jgi:2,3-dihydroxybenzoate-AMP ligase
MLEGFVPFPPDYAARYRERGYWRDQSLAQEFAAVFERFATRTALIDSGGGAPGDGVRRWTYAELDAASDNLALNLLDLGLKPLDRVVPTLPNVAEFVILYFALQKIGCIPIAALVTHRYAEISQFTRLAQARCAVYPAAVREQGGEFRFAPVIDRVQAENPCLQIRLVLGEPGPGEHSLSELIARPAARPRSALRALHIEPTDPCIFQLSGGTTGIPKLIPRTNNDYAYNSKVAAEVAGVDAGSVLLLVLPIAHNLPLACPGIQGFLCCMPTPSRNRCSG